MKASELVAALQVMIAEHGDKDVHVYADGAWDEARPGVLTAEQAKCPREWASVPPGDFCV